jgi:hypothetical protein
VQSIGKTPLQKLICMPSSLLRKNLQDLLTLFVHLNTMAPLLFAYKNSNLMSGKKRS